MKYEAPAVTDVTPVSGPLIGTAIPSGFVNPQWNDEPAED